MMITEYAIVGDFFGVFNDLWLDCLMLLESENRPEPHVHPVPPAVSTAAPPIWTPSDRRSTQGPDLAPESPHDPAPMCPFLFKSLCTYSICIYKYSIQYD